MKNTFNKIYKKESPESLLRTHCISVRLNHEETTASQCKAWRQK